MQRYHILWADDEIELLKPHILFLNNKGYDVTPVNSGNEAVDLSAEKNFDVVFLDENMPGLSGLEALSLIKTNKPNLPVVMITKSEEEHIMEDAIGKKIADYLIKPLNPNQILLSVKKILDNKRLISEKTNLSYQQDFRNLSMEINERLSPEQWIDVYKKLVFWELEIDQSRDKSMLEVFQMQKADANHNFSNFIIKNYESWLNDANVVKPILSNQLLKKKVFPTIENKIPTVLILIDNLRFDQWKVLEPIIAEYFTVEEESGYYSILPTTTAYARNAIFSGQMPSEIEKTYPNLWVGDDEEEGKNLHEEELLNAHLKRARLDYKTSYQKITNLQHGKSLVDGISNLMNFDFNVVVYNFVDMLSHARTDMNMIRELAPDESAYRSLTKSWFEHSPLLEAIKKLSEKKVRLIITTDHGTIRVNRPFKIVGDKTVNTNLRYKNGKNLGFDGKEIFEVKRPEKLFLPKQHMTSTFVFAVRDFFFAYPNNYNYYVNYFTDTFQHGGVSLEEIIVPFIKLKPKFD